MLKYWLISLFLISFLLGITQITKAESEIGLEWQYRTSQLSLSTVKGSYWLNDNWGVGGNYFIADRCLSASILYKTKPFVKNAFNYVGLGFRDINDTYNSGLNLGQKLEFTAGTEWNLSRLINGLAISLEARIIPSELFNHNDNTKPVGFTPVLGIGFIYHLTEGSSPYQRTQTEEPVSDNDLYLLAKLITAEAGDEPYDGQVAVGAVVLNRTRSGELPGHHSRSHLSN